jgi:hypothetical protein
MMTTFVGATILRFLDFGRQHRVDNVMAAVIGRGEQLVAYVRAGEAAQKA